MSTQSELLEAGRTFDENGIAKPTEYENAFFNNVTGTVRWNGDRVFRYDGLLHSHELSHIWLVGKVGETYKNAATFGVEMEYDNVGRMSDEFFRYLQKNRYENNSHYVIKTDGSLDGGLEAVTMPFTPEAYEKRMKRVITEYITDAKEYGAKSTDNCGLHVHIGRDSIPKKAFAFLVHWTYNFQREVEAIAGRESNGYCVWRKPIGYWWEEGNLSKQYSAKYSVWNLAKGPTVEFRLNRGSARISRVLARIEFVMAMTAFAVNFTAKYEKGMPDWETFRQFVAKNQTYFPTLKV